MLCRLILSFLVVLIVASFPNDAFAQSVSGVSGAQAGRAEQQVSRRMTSTKSGQTIDIAARIAESAPKGAEKNFFVLDHLQLDGVTAYTQGDLEPIYGPYLGQKISLADLYIIAAALQQKYLDDGYLLARVSVPKNPVHKGSARLIAHEGYIRQVSVTGVTNAHTLTTVQGYLGHVAGSRQALNTEDLQHAMFLVNDLPGINARAHLIPVKDDAEGYDLLIDAGYKPYDAVIGLDNYGTRYIGPYQVSGELALNGLLGQDERIDIQTVIAPDLHNSPELYYLGLNYQQPISSRGTILEVFGNSDYVSPGYNLKPYDAHGRAWHTGLSLLQSFVRSQYANLKAHITFDMRNTSNWDNAFATQYDRIRTIRGGMQGDYKDNWLDRAAANAFVLEVSQGLNILNATENGNFTSHPAARPDFTKITAELQRLQNVADNVDVFFGLNGQWANKPLYSAEEFGVGGSQYGRGYYFSDILGDKGIAAKVEVQWNRPSRSQWFDHYQLYAFLDAGKVWNFNRDIDQPPTGELLSTGVGFRTSLNSNVDMDFTIAQPLNRDVPAQGNRAPRFLFSMAKKF
ncbi:MAG: Hemolysin activation/secretion protein [Micavibrio sp.]|nr:Hemolysin activation/secretion protein [Micavibrio sp.]